MQSLQIDSAYYLEVKSRKIWKHNQIDRALEWVSDIFTVTWVTTANVHTFRHPVVHTLQNKHNVEQYTF